MRPIGIFGGTFDPIHYGHLRTALELKALLDLDKVHIVPVANPPHRTQPMSDGALRLRMVEAAIRDWHALLKKVQSGDGTAGKFVNDPALYNDFRRVLARVDSLTLEFKKNPRKFINLEIF